MTMCMCGVAVDEAIERCAEPEYPFRRPPRRRGGTARLAVFAEGELDPLVGH